MFAIENYKKLVRIGITESDNVARIARCGNVVNPPKFVKMQERNENQMD
jgi:hypothetical protein